MWAMGYTDPFDPNGPTDVILTKDDTFRHAFGELVEFVDFELNRAKKDDWWNFDHFAQIDWELGQFIANGNLQTSDVNQVDTWFTDDIGEIHYFVIKL
jgi:hypothetical protein